MPELGFQYELTRSDRRTLSIKISRDAKVLVYAPRRMSLKHIEDFLFEKRAWVLKNLAKVQERKDIPIRSSRRESGLRPARARVSADKSSRATRRI